MTKRIFIDPQHLPPAPCDVVPLPQDLQHYIFHVLRMHPGDTITLIDGQGRHITGTLTLEHLSITADEQHQHNESPLQLRLYQSIPKGERWEFVLEKATELGISHISPLQTERSVVKIPPKKIATKHQRWHKIIQSATRQSQRDHTPTLDHPTTFKQALQQLNPSAHHIMCHTQHDRTTLPTTFPTPTPLTLWIGPEGGWSENERALFLQHPNTHILQSGPRVLRTETAAITTIALIQHLYGDLNWTS